MAQLEVPNEDLKMLRETLCIAQSYINWKAEESRREEHSNRLQGLIDQIDSKRPLWSNGKHGNLHTPECGCDFDDGRCPEICPDTGIVRAYGYVVGSRCTAEKGHSVYRNGVGHLFAKGPSNRV